MSTKEEAHFVDSAHSMSGDATGDTTWQTNNYRHVTNVYKDYVIYILSIPQSAYQINYRIDKLDDDGDGTFTLDEFTSGIGRCFAVGFDGTYIYGVDSTSDVVRKFDLNLDVVTSWQDNGTKSISGLNEYTCAVDPDTGKVVVSDSTTVYLLDSDGNEIWSKALVYEVRHAYFSASGDILVQRYGNTGTGGYKLNIANGDIIYTYATDLSQHGSPYDVVNDIAENPVTGQIILIGRYAQVLGVHAFPATGGGENELEWTDTFSHSPNCVHCTQDGNIYIGSYTATNPGAGTVHKYSSSGSYAGSYDTNGVAGIWSIAERNSDSIFVGGYRGENEDGYTNTMHVLDSSLAYYGGYDHGDNDYGYNSIRGFVFPVTTISPDPVVTGTQDRTVWYLPDTTDYSHLEGETVQVLGDGVYQGEEIVVSGDISLDDNTTNNHVGLKITSKIQPMKIGGISKIKRISKLIPDVYESLDGEYGEALDDMYAMTLRDSGDPMDRDSDLYSGYLELPFKGQYDRDSDIWIRADIPLPMSLIGLGVDMSMEAV